MLRDTLPWGKAKIHLNFECYVTEVLGVQFLFNFTPIFAGFARTESDAINLKWLPLRSTHMQLAQVSMMDQ
jgi:hypothetical protein